MENISKTIPQDLTRINIFEQDELNWWTDQLNVSTSLLKEGVRAVGTSAAAVIQFIGRHKTF